VMPAPDRTDAVATGRNAHAITDTSLRRTVV
jgi:hypothetical protein